MTTVRSYTRGPELKRRQKAVVIDLTLEPILRQLDADIRAWVDHSVENDDLFTEFPELRGMSIGLVL